MKEPSEIRREVTVLMLGPKGRGLALENPASLIGTLTSSFVPKVKLKPELSTWEGRDGPFAGVMKESLMKKTPFTKMRAGLKEMDEGW